MNTANMAAVMALAISATDTGFIPPAGSPTPLGGLRPNGGKYGPFTLGARERSRLAWRQRVDAAARAWAKTDFGTWEEALDALRTLDAALAAPRPWRSPRKPDPRNHYPRSHRRACRRCDMYRRTMAVVRCAKRYPLVMDAGFYEREAEAWRRNPHGRSGR